MRQALIKSSFRASFSEFVKEERLVATIRMHISLCLGPFPNGAANTFSHNECDFRGALPAEHKQLRAEFLPLGLICEAFSALASSDPNKLRSRQVAVSTPTLQETGKCFAHFISFFLRFFLLSLSLSTGFYEDK